MTTSLFTPKWEVKLTDDRVAYTIECTAGNISVTSNIKYRRDRIRQGDKFTIINSEVYRV